MRRRGQSALKAVKELDAFPKISENYVETTATGGSVSILTFVFIGALVVAELLYYTDSELNYEYEVDKDFTGKMKLNVDLTIAMPCDYIGADVVDVTGEDKHGEGEIEEQSTWFEMAPNQKTYHQMMESVNTYMREEYHSLHEVLWAQGPVSHYAMPARSEQPERDHDACRLHGSYTINKVAGNFHITAGKSLPVLGGGHAHLALGGGAYNFSHRIDHLSFGDTAAGRINPLDAELKVTTNQYYIFQYFMKVVPTYVHTRHNRMDTYQLAVTERERVLDHSKGSHGTPGIFFKYDLASFKVKVREQNKPLGQLLIRLCGIIGGVFATSGIVNAFVKFCVCRFNSRHKSSSSASARTDTSNLSEAEGAQPTPSSTSLAAPLDTSSLPPTAAVLVTPHEPAVLTVNATL